MRSGPRSVLINAESAAGGPDRAMNDREAIKVMIEFP